MISNQFVKSSFHYLDGFFMISFLQIIKIEIFLQRLEFKIIDVPTFDVVYLLLM
jgi:hypothetical protein